MRSLLSPLTTLIALLAMIAFAGPMCAPSDDEDDPPQEPLEAETTSDDSAEPTEPGAGEALVDPAEDQENEESDAWEEAPLVVQGDITEPAWSMSWAGPPALDGVIIPVADELTAMDLTIHAFPPIMPDREWHRNAWIVNDCLKCHETGVAEAPVIQHAGMPEILLHVQCRTCHVLIPGRMDPPRSRSRKELVSDAGFDANAFPPLIPDTDLHRHLWSRDNCLMCHGTGALDAPIVVHEDMPSILLQANCRTCHVAVRAWEPGKR